VLCTCILQSDIAIRLTDIIIALIKHLCIKVLNSCCSGLSCRVEQSGQANLVMQSWLTPIGRHNLDYVDQVLHPSLMPIGWCSPSLRRSSDVVLTLPIGHYSLGLCRSGDVFLTMPIERCHLDYADRAMPAILVAFMLLHFCWPEQLNCINVVATYFSQTNNHSDQIDNDWLLWPTDQDSFS
jgi:hypothetical protein